MTSTNREKINAALQAKALDNKISCAVARQLAAELQVPIREVGESANELKIKIKACELGCFD